MRLSLLRKGTIICLLRRTRLLLRKTRIWSCWSCWGAWTEEGSGQPQNTRTALRHELQVVTTPPPSYSTRTPSRVIPWILLTHLSIDPRLQSVIAPPSHARRHDVALLRCASFSLIVMLTWIVFDINVAGPPNSPTDRQRQATTDWEIDRGTRHSRRGDFDAGSTSSE